MRLPRPRGPLSADVVNALRADGPVSLDPAAPFPGDLLRDEDFHLALWILNELHYRGFDEVPDHEWAPAMIARRGPMQDAFETELRSRTAEVVGAAAEHTETLAGQLAFLIDAVDGPNLAGYLQREAPLEHVREFLAQRSLYHLKESDPHSFVLARIDGRAKTHLAELLHDEYGAGRPARLHARLYADALEGAGLDRTYGAYVDQTPGHVLAVNNVMSLFGLQRRLRGAALGHLAAFESTSSVPCRKIAAGIERVGLPGVVAAYFHEHVEADAAHEQVVVRDICGGLLDDEPEQRREVLFGAAACLWLDAVSATALLDGWLTDGAPHRVAS